MAVEDEEEVSKFNSSNDLIMIINRKITTIMIMHDNNNYNGNDNDRHNNSDYDNDDNTS